MARRLEDCDQEVLARARDLYMALKRALDGGEELRALYLALLKEKLLAAQGIARRLKQK